MKVLVTNDDGVRARGLRALATGLVEAGHDVSIVGPLTQHSGGGTGIGGEIMGALVRTTRIDDEQLPGVPILGIDGPPAAAVLAVVHGLVSEQLGGPPDFVVSGINSGHNLGRLALHSGTLGAASTAALYGLPAIAISCSPDPTGQYEAAADFCARLLATYSGDWPVGEILNINFPDAPLDLEEVVVTTLSRGRRGEVAMELLADGFRMNLLRDFSETRRTGQAGESDAEAIGRGCVSVTRLLGGLFVRPEIRGNAALDRVCRTPV